MSGTDFNSTAAKESSEFPTGDFLGGFLGFWLDFGGLRLPVVRTNFAKVQGLSENPDKFGEIW